MNELQKFLQHGEREYTHKRLGLERIAAVLETLGHPEKAYPSVLIAGTNGKGSVARMVEGVLTEAGYKAGLYTSPHVERFTERIRVGGSKIEEEFLEETLRDFLHRGILTSEGEIPIPVERAFRPVPDRQVRPTVTGEEAGLRGEEAGLKALATWFEKVTVLAFEVFRRREIDLGILEVGLGARLDATNVVDPKVSAITSIGMDHAEILGNSPFEIAREKLYVMRKGCPLILGPMDPNVRTFLSKAARLGEAQPVLPPMPRGHWQNFSYGPFERLALGMPGRHQMGNAATAIEILIALKEAGFDIDNAHVHQGLAEAKLPARLEIFPGKPTLLLDGAHNPQAFEPLADLIRQDFPGKALTVILGMMGDKDPGEALKILAPLNPRWILTGIPHSPRALKIEDWRGLMERWKFSPEPLFFQDPLKALETGKKLCSADGLLLIAGSFYLAGIIRPRLLSGPTTR